MTESCCCPPEAGNTVCELPVENLRPPARKAKTCPQCGKIGKPIQGQTIKSHVSVSLRQVQDVQYFFCATETCPVVYFSDNGQQTFSVDDIREQVYQKEPEAEDVFICYCFRHRVGELRLASTEERLSIMDNINSGIDTGQCACDLRNPQGSCCLGNVRGMIKQLDQKAAAST